MQGLPNFYMLLWISVKEQLLFMIRLIDCRSLFYVGFNWLYADNYINSLTKIYFWFWILGEPADKLWFDESIIPLYRRQPTPELLSSETTPPLVEERRFLPTATFLPSTLGFLDDWLLRVSMLVMFSFSCYFLVNISMGLSLTSPSLLVKMLWTLIYLLVTSISISVLAK